MAINNINNTSHILNISANNQTSNTSKLSSGFRIDRNADTAAILSIKTPLTDGLTSARENSEAAMSNINSIDEADKMVSTARENILSSPQQSVLAQANQESVGVINLVQ